MCGIAGVVHPDPRCREREAVRAMSRALAHRGPDGSGLFEAPGVCLGHRRLAVIDPAGGAQPMADETERVAVASNSEFYAFRRLRRRLTREGWSFRTRSDTEVLLRGYQAWGDNVLESLDGLFAFAVWDGSARSGPRLLLARDRMGQKPLYWTALADGGLAFASELTALLRHPEVHARIDPGALRRYLLHEYVPSPRTAIAGVFKLEPAQRLVWQAGRGPLISHYWSARHPVVDEVDGSGAVAEVRPRLRRAVERRLVADVPLGVFLSGGLDSSAVLAEMATLVDPSRIRTFAVGFDDASFDESSHARAVATHFGTEHHERTLRPEDVLDLLPRVATLMDEPLADASLVPTHLLARFAREHVTVALGGDGGDELFSGYPTFLAERAVPLWQALPGFARRAVARGAHHVPVSTANFNPGFVARAFVRGADLPDVRRHQVWLGSFPPVGQERLLAPALRPSVSGDDPLDDLADWTAARTHRNHWDRLGDYYARYYLADDVLTKVDRATMAVALEARSPFLDHELVRWAVSLPQSARVRGRATKWILRRAYEGALPRSILRRPKKGFGIPMAAWLRGPLRSLVDRVLAPDRLRRQGLFEPKAVHCLVSEHEAGTDDHHKPLWTLIAWQLWAERIGAELT